MAEVTAQAAPEGCDASCRTAASIDALNRTCGVACLVFRCNTPRILETRQPAAARRLDQESAAIAGPEARLPLVVEKSDAPFYWV